MACRKDNEHGHTHRAHGGGSSGHSHSSSSGQRRGGGGGKGSSSKRLSLCEAKEEFMAMVDRIGNEEEVRKFVDWIGNLFDDDEDENGTDDSPILQKIAEELRQQLPINATSPDEQIVYPSEGLSSECTAATTIHVDGFLFDDDAVDDLVDEGKMSRAFCTACGSHATKPLNFISHSMSIAQLRHMYDVVLPDLSGLTVVDVGSRLGAVLYAGHAHSKAAKLIGIELNPYFCKLQRETAERHKMNDRITVVEGDILENGALLKDADVVVMNNVFEFFSSREQQRKLWRFVRENTRSGCMMVTVPSLETSLSDAQCDFGLDGWAQAEPVEETGDEDLDALHLYTTD